MEQRDDEGLKPPASRVNGSPANDTHPYTVKGVVNRTGLTPHIIRTWEKRYGAVEPQRSPTNRRLYSDADIERLILLRQLTLTCHRIGRIANLPIDTLRALSVADDVTSSAVISESNRSTDHLSVTPHLAACLEAVQRVDAEALNVALTKASVEFGQPVLIEHVIAPFMRQLGELWHAGLLRMAHEHLASVVVRHFLRGLRSAYSRTSSAPSLIVTTPAGHLHEIGALMVAATARVQGWDVIYLGPNLPAAEIAAAIQPRVKAIALSLVYSQVDSYLGQELLTLRRCVPADFHILAGGPLISVNRDFLEAIGVVRINDLSELRSHLTLLRTFSF